MTEEKKKLSFGGGLLIYITVMFTLIFVALAVWWHYLACYETSRCDGVMDAYMTQTLQKELEDEITEYARVKSTGYQARSVIVSTLTDALSGDRWHYELDPTADPPVYALYCDDLAVGRAELHREDGGTLRFGFDLWQTPDTTFDFAQFGKTIQVTVPYGCQLYLSGEPISEDLVQTTIGLYPQLQAYEAMISEPNQLLVYEIGEVFGDVAVEYSGGYTALKSEEEDVYYAIPTCEDHMAEELIEYCKGFVRAYVDYSANLTSLWALQQYLVTDSALYKEVTDGAASMAWSQGVNAVVETVGIKNFTYYGNVITCDASYITKRDDGDRLDSMSILLAKTSIGWRVMHINVG